MRERKSVCERESVCVCVCVKESVCACAEERERMSPPPDAERAAVEADE